MQVGAYEKRLYVHVRYELPILFLYDVVLGLGRLVRAI